MLHWFVCVLLVAREAFLFKIVASFQGPFEDRVGMLKKGDEITIEGRIAESHVKQYEDTHVWTSLFVRLVDVRIVSPLPEK
jgi:hypothetical protein